MLNQFIERACDFSRRHFDLCVDAQCQSRQIDFDAIMAMDAEIQSLLDQRPDWMRFEEKDSKELWSDTQSIEMVRARSYSSFIVATLWHRRFYIVSETSASSLHLLHPFITDQREPRTRTLQHRPFLTLSRLYPKTYGESASRCVHAAKQFVTVCQRGRERRLLVANANVSLLCHVDSRHLSTNASLAISIPPGPSWSCAHNSARHVSGLIGCKGQSRSRGRA